MFNGKKVLMSLFVILLIVAFYNDNSYSQEKPSEKIIKQTILKGYSRSIDKFTKDNPNIKVYDLKYDSFKITKGFISKTPAKAGESVPYNIEVSYKISYKESQNLAKWKADKIKEYENNIRMSQEALKKHEAEADKPTELIDFDKKSIIGNKENIETVKKMTDIKQENRAIVKNNDKMSFIKKGGKWIGYLGWK
jgi:hypothetical protein